MTPAEVDELDRTWFAQHPLRCCRIRRAIVGEQYSIPPPREELGTWLLTHAFVYRSWSGQLKRRPIYVGLFG